MKSAFSGRTNVGAFENYYFQSAFYLFLSCSIFDRMGLGDCAESNDFMTRG